MSPTITTPRIKSRTAVQRPRLYKVILINDDYTPREFVVRVLKSEFSMPESAAMGVMLTAHTKGSCVVAVFTKEIAETKSDRANEAARQQGYPLTFTIEPEQ